MTKHLMFLLLLAVSLPGVSQNAQLNFNQNAVGISTSGSAPDNSAILDVKSTEAGILLPRLSVAQRDAIVQPATGLLVFVTDSVGFYFNAGTSGAPLWKKLGSGGRDGFGKRTAAVHK